MDNGSLLAAFFAPAGIAILVGIGVAVVIALIGLGIGLNALIGVAVRRITASVSSHRTQRGPEREGVRD